MTGIEFARPPAQKVYWKLLTATALIVCAVSALASAAFPAFGWLLLGGASVLLLVALVAYRPVIGTYLYFATLPLIAGIDRDTLVPLVRPNEAVLAIVLIAAVIGGSVRWSRSAATPFVLTRVDRALAGFALFATIWPVTSVFVRGSWPTPAEMAAILPVAKIIALYLLVRCTIATRRQAMVLTRLVVWPSAAVALIATLQVTGFAPVVAVLHEFYLPDEPVSEISARGSSTLASPIATGGVIVIALIVLLCCFQWRLLRGWESLVLGGLLGAGLLAVGQFSTWISAAFAFVLLLGRFPQLRTVVLRAAPLAVIAGLIGIPVVIRRLMAFDDDAGVPVSWLGRWDNLSNFYLPRFDLPHLFTGVSPNPVLEAPETWRTVIYLESGYLYWLWIGGLPLLAMFGWLSVEVLRTADQLRANQDISGAFASALGIYWWALLVISVIDPHLTIRGTGDLTFSLLALTIGRKVARNAG